MTDLKEKPESPIANFMNLVALEKMVGLIENQGFLDNIDFQEAPALLRTSVGRNILLRLLKSEHIPAFELASYVLSEEGPKSQKYMDRVVAELRVLDRDTDWLFCSIVFHHREFWHQNYADLFLRAINSGFVPTRQRAIAILSDDNCSALVDCHRFLADLTQIDYLGSGIREAYTGSIDWAPQETPDDVELTNLEFFLQTIDLKRAVRAMYLSQTIRDGKFDEVRTNGVEEDSILLDYLSDLGKQNV